MTYTHLSQDERYQIHHFYRACVSIRWIAELLDRSPSSISRELKRNADDGNYQAGNAQRISAQRRSVASAVPRISLSEWRKERGHLLSSRRGRWAGRKPAR